MNIEVGEDSRVINVILRRVKEGVRVDVRVAPSVEEFFRHWGGGSQSAVTLQGRMWRPVSADASAALRSWNVMSIDIEDGGFDLFAVGQDIHHSTERGTNISFLRLVGAGTPEGASFIVDTVVSREGLEKLAERIRRACGRFYEQFIKPANFHIAVETRVLEGIGNG